MSDERCAESLPRARVRSFLARKIGARIVPRAADAECTGKKLGASRAQRGGDHYDINIDALDERNGTEQRTRDSISVDAQPRRPRGLNAPVIK